MFDNGGSGSATQDEEALSRCSFELEHVRLLRAAVRHRYNLIAAAAVFVVAFPVGCGGISLLMIASHLASWLVLPRLSWFRRQVDAQRALEEGRAAVAVRMNTLGRISDEHRLRFLRLECLVDEIGRHLDHAGADDTGDCYGLRWLLSSYLSLATAHRAAKQMISVMPREVLAAEIAAIRDQQAAHPALHALHEQRREITQRRLSRWDRTAGELERLGEQLATIDSMIQLAHESISATSIDGASVGAQQLIDDLADGRGVLESLTALPIQLESIDPRVFVSRADGAPAADDERESPTLLFGSPVTKTA